MQGASWWTSFIQACLQSVWGRPHCLINQRTAMSSLTTLHCLQVKDTERKLTDNFWPGFHKGIMQKGLIIISGYHVSFPSFNIYCFKLNQLALFFSLSLPPQDRQNIYSFITLVPFYFCPLCWEHWPSLWWFSPCGPAPSYTGFEYLLQTKSKPTF